MVTGDYNYPSKTYSVATPIFEGPLDLLLQLIEKTELDITRLAIAQVTDQYLDYLNHLQEREAEEVSLFLVIAAKLLQIKSAVLLPRPSTYDAMEEDTGDALARQLLLYKRYKEIAGFLDIREQAGLHTYLRIAAPKNMPTKIEIGEYSIVELVEAAKAMLARIDDRPKIDSVVKAPRITIREKILQISKYLHKHGKGTFKSLFHRKSTQADVVITFLAMLELIKRHLIVAKQTKLFGDIELETSDAWVDDVDYNFEIEFDE